MELNSNQIASVKCDDNKTMFMASEKSREILERYVEDNPEYTYDIDINYDYHLQEDKGYRLSTVRNKGIELVENDCIVQLDDDYLLTGNVLNKARELFDKDKFIIFRRDEMDEENNIIRDKRVRLNWTKDKVGSNLFKFIPGGNPLRISAIWGMVMYSKEVAEYVGGYSEAYNQNWGAEDCDFGTRFLYAGCDVLYYIGEKCVHLEHEKRPNRFIERKKNTEILDKKLEEYRMLKKFNNDSEI